MPPKLALSGHRGVGTEKKRQYLLVRIDLLLTLVACALHDAVSCVKSNARERHSIDKKNQYTAVLINLGSSLGKAERFICLRCVLPTLLRLFRLGCGKGREEGLGAAPISQRGRSECVRVRDREREERVTGKREREKTAEREGKSKIDGAC